MVKINTWLIVLSINLCLTLSEKIETAKVEKATVAKAEEVKPVLMASTTQRVVVISEKTQAELQLDEEHKKEEKKGNVDQQGKEPIDDASVHSNLPNNYDKVMQRIDIDLESSVRTGFYILMTISAGALLFVGWKIYKLRLSRAERKYGVQGDRTTQELAPLPVSMEDADSDDDDQTIFDAHRQIRIY